jgi:hypothetical protein
MHRRATVATESVTARSLLISGTVGVGKTSVLLEIGEQLTLGDAPFALVDLDWLAWLRPSRASHTTVSDVLSENLGHVSRTRLETRAAGRDRSRYPNPAQDTNGGTRQFAIPEPGPSQERRHATGRDTQNPR